MIPQARFYSSGNLPFWHFHPEVELVYVHKGKGKVHIGNHLSYFNSGQLLLLGANLPHHGFSDRLTAKGSETIVQFKPDFLGEHFFNVPEMQKVKNMFQKAKKGILFNTDTKTLVGSKIENLSKSTGIERILKFIEILNDLSMAPNYTLLNVDGFAIYPTLYFHL